MAESFLLAWRALVRGHVLTLLLGAAGLVHLLVPALVRSDGTMDGWREMFVRAVPGSVYVVTAVALLACACGLFAHERETNRLAQTVVRPVSAFALAAGRLAALASVAALVLVLNATLLLAREGWTNCRHVFTPNLLPPSVVASRALEDYLRDPQTPEAVKQAPRHTVLSLLTNKELDRYDTIPAGETMQWPFRVDKVSQSVQNDRDIAVRVRFATQFDMRASVSGWFQLQNWCGMVSNSTQSVIEVPLTADESRATAAAGSLSFRNAGTSSVMLRPRRDLQILVPADSFRWNLLRATVEMFSVVMFLCAFGLFLSSALARPVALFTAFVALLVVVMAPGVVAQFPDELDVAMSDRLGLWISRGVSMVTASFADASPVADLATGTCIEWNRLLRSVLVNAVATPALLLTLTALVVRRKPLR